MITDNLPTSPEKFITDLNDFDGNEKSVRVSASAENIERLKELPIDNLWLTGANERDLTKILPHVKLKYLILYQIKAFDLTILETQNNPEAIILNWNTKVKKLWDITKNTNLKVLEITDFSKLNDIEKLSSATQLESLILNGGMWNALKIKTLSPLTNLPQLKYLSLINIKVEDNTLKPLGELKNLERLDISNQFETKEYAWLATRLPKTTCKLFSAINTCPILDGAGNLLRDTMITGKRKPFLLSAKDQVKIDKYIEKFERLKIDLAEYNYSPL